MKIYDFKKLLTKRIIFVVLFQGHVYPFAHFKRIHGAFRWFSAEKLINSKFYEIYVFKKILIYILNLIIHVL